MINWNILGIEPTDDKAAIKKAYRTRLAETNPEDKPDEFMELREAYEAALEYARRPKEDTDTNPGEADSPSSLETDLLPPDHPAYDWSHRLQALYRDFYRRIDGNCWTELASDPVCTRIDTRADVQDALLRFLMEWWFLPDDAIRALNETFDFEGNREFLMARYPAEFVDAILLTPLERQGGGLEYGLFEGAPDADYDTYINLYYTLAGLVGRHENKEAWDCISQMKELDIHHPFLHVEQAKLYLNEEKPDLASAEIEAIWPTYDSSPTVCCMAGEVALAADAFESALTCFNRCMELLPDSRWAKLGLAETHLGLKHYEEAQKWIDEVLAEDRYSPRGQALEESIQEARKGGLVEKLAAEEATAKERLDLAVIYIDAGDFQSACDVLTAFTAKEKKDEAERLHYLATAELGLEQYKASRHHFTDAAGLLAELLLVTSEEAEKMKISANLARTRVMESVCLEQLDQLEEALETVTNVTIDHPDLNMPHCRRAELLYEMKQFEECIQAATRSLDLDDTFHLPYRIRGNAYYELGYYNDAYQDCVDCIERFAGDIEAYFCKINILIEVGEFDMAFEELDSLEEQVKGTQISFLRAKALEASGQTRKARDIYMEILKQYDDPDREVYPPAELKTLAGIYYRLSQVLQTIFQESGQSNYWRASLKYLKEGVKKYPADIDLLSELAGELYGQSQHQDAQKLYERLIELDPDGSRYAQLAGNEIQMDQFDRALLHLAQAESMDANLVYVQILYASVNTCLENYPQALQYLDRARELADRQERPWPRILQDKSMVYARMKEYDKAIQCLRENYEIYQKQDDYSAMMEMYRLSGRFQEAIDIGKQWLADHPGEDASFVIDEMKLSAINLSDYALLSHCCESDSRLYQKNFYMGRYLMYSDDYGEQTPKTALFHFKEAEKSDPSSIHNLIEIAKLYFKLKDKKKAYEYAGKVLELIPEDFMECGYQRSFYLSRSAEALAILGQYREAEERIQLALSGRKCDFCQYSGCIDACCAMVYMCCIRGDEAGAAKYRQLGLDICPHDFDLQYYPAYFMKKRGFFR